MNTRFYSRIITVAESGDADEMRHLLTTSGAALCDQLRRDKDVGGADDFVSSAAFGGAATLDCALEVFADVGAGYDLRRIVENLCYSQPDKIALLLDRGLDPFAPLYDPGDANVPIGQASVDSVPVDYVRSYHCYPWHTTLTLLLNEHCDDEAVARVIASGDVRLFTDRPGGRTYLWHALANPKNRAVAEQLLRAGAPLSAATLERAASSDHVWVLERAAAATQRTLCEIVNGCMACNAPSAPAADACPLPRVPLTRAEILSVDAAWRRCADRHRDDTIVDLVQTFVRRYLPDYVAKYREPLEESAAWRAACADGAAAAAAVWPGCAAAHR